MRFIIGSTKKLYIKVQFFIGTFFAYILNGIAYNIVYFCVNDYKGGIRDVECVKDVYQWAADRLEERGDQFAKTDTLNNGKPLRESEFDVNDAGTFGFEEYTEVKQINNNLKVEPIGWFAE